MIAKLLIVWACLILGGLLLLFLAAAFAESYVKGGASSVAILAVIVSAFPALFMGLWLRSR